MLVAHFISVKLEILFISMKEMVL